MPRLLILITLLLSFLTPAAYAQDADPVTITATPQFTAAHPGDRLAIAVRFELAEHMHIWPNQPVAPKGAPGFTAIPTLIVFSGDVSTVPHVTARFDAINWPAPEVIKVAGYTAAAHEGSFTVYLPVAIAKDAPLGNFTIPLTVKAQACDEITCYQPVALNLPVTIKIVPAAEPTVPADPALFAAFDAAVFDTPIRAMPKPAPTPPPAADLGIGGGSVSGLWLILLFAVLGGVILNFTPCVLPIIPLKIMGLHQQSGSRARTAWLGLVIFFGVASFWIVLGALIAFGVLSTVSGLSGTWQFNLGVGLFMATMGLGMFDLFSVGLPKWVYNIEVGHDTMFGSFLFGVMTAVLATPCVGPFAGGMAAYALTQPPEIALLIFLAVGVGMGLPYLILAFFPKLLAWIPRAGPASELLKQVLGLLMIAFGLLFVAFGVLVIVAMHPWVARVLHWWLVYAVIVMAALWLILRTWRITRSVGRRLIFTLLGLLIIAGGYQVPRSLGQDARDAFLRADRGLWTDYDAKAVDRALADGKVVVMEFTAEWCLICKGLEANVLYTPQVDLALENAGVRSFKVDITDQNPDTPERKRLRAEGGAGVPYLVILGPGQSKPWTRTAYTISEVVEGIRHAHPKP